MQLRRWAHHPEDLPDSVCQMQSDGQCALEGPTREVLALENACFEGYDADWPRARARAACADGRLPEDAGLPALGCDVAGIPALGVRVADEEIPF